MAAKTSTRKATKRVSRRGAAKIARRRVTEQLTGASIAMEEARRAGLLDGDKTEHLSFRAPKALVEAAKRESGATGPTELGLLALAVLAQTDPSASFLKETHGTLGSHHKLDY